MSSIHPWFHSVGYKWNKAGIYQKKSSQNTNLMVLCTANYFFVFFGLFWTLSQFSVQHGRRKTQTLQVSTALRCSRWTGRSSRSNLAPVSLSPVPPKVPLAHMATWCIWNAPVTQCCLHWQLCTALVSPGEPQQMPGAAPLWDFNCCITLILDRTETCSSLSVLFSLLNCQIKEKYSSFHRTIIKMCGVVYLCNTDTHYIYS